MNRGRLLVALSILIVAAAALAIRLPRLGRRPMHNDEANQAAKAGILLETGRYDYDPQDHHGPSLYWLTLPALRLRGVESFAASSEADYRIVPVAFGVGMVLLLLLMVDGLGLGPTLAAGALTALSPAMVYYSRDYIQEMLLAFFTLAAIGCGWRWFRSGRLAWAIVAGASLGMMHATKETWVLSAAAMAVAVVFAAAWERSSSTSPPMARAPRPTYGRRPACPAVRKHGWASRPWHPCDWAHGNRSPSPCRLGRHRRGRRRLLLVLRRAVERAAGFAAGLRELLAPRNRKRNPLPPVALLSSVVDCLPSGARHVLVRGLYRRAGVRGPVGQFRRSSGRLE